MQDIHDLDAASADGEPSPQQDVSRRELLERIERYAYAAPALTLLVTPQVAAAYGGDPGRGNGRGGGKDGGPGKGGKGDGSGKDHAGDGKGGGHENGAGQRDRGRP
jgi:hypothetical protein